MVKPVIIWTNGCFDLFHPGHLYILKESKSMGDILIVGLNTDQSVKCLKGSGRPIDKYRVRKTNLLATGLVDKVIPIGMSPLNAICKVKPDIIVKGGDYKKEEVIGNEHAEVRILRRIPKYSTSRLIRTR